MPTSLKCLTQLLIDFSKFWRLLLWMLFYSLPPSFFGIKFQCAHVVKVFLHSVQISSLSPVLSRSLSSHWPWRTVCCHFIGEDITRSSTNLLFRFKHRLFCLFVCLIMEHTKSCSIFGLPALDTNLPYETSTETLFWWKIIWLWFLL